MDGRVSTRQIGSGEGGRTAKENGQSGRPVGGRPFVERRDRPVHVHDNRVVADRDCRRNRRLSVRRFVKHRTGEPHHVAVIDVALDLEIVRIVRGVVVRSEVAVRDGVIVAVIVNVSRLVDVLRREG